MHISFFKHTVTELNRFWHFWIVLVVLFLSSLEIHAQTTYTTSGNYAVPAGVSKILVECWGGGGGGSTVSAAVRGGGGGGGAYARSVVVVTPSTSYPFIVGASGAASSAGGNTTFNSTIVVADGGNGGTTNSSAGASGGLATASTGDFTYNGGNGGTGSTYSGGGGGSAGTNNPGGNANAYTAGVGGVSNGGNGATGVASNSNGTAATGNGGGGSGAARNSAGTSRNGGAGAKGSVRITPIYVEVSATGGSTWAYYTTLKAALDAINLGTHTGVVDVKLWANLTETATVAFTAAGSYTSVTIYPMVDGLTINCSAAVTGALINLNNADNVTIDGRVNKTGARSLTINNINTGAGVSTIQFTGNALNNSIQYCKLKGGSSGNTSGTLNFSTGTNTGNSVNNCEITNNGTRRPYAIYCNSGTNSGNSLTDNLIYDNWLVGTSSTSIYLGSGASGWSITGNSIYDTGVATLGGNVTYSAIYISNTSNTSAFTVSGNYIGGDAAGCGDPVMSIGTSGTLRTAIFNPIYLSVNTSPASLVQNNYIQNIDLKSSSSAPFTGIDLYSGSATININKIGDQAGIKPLTITTSVNSNSYGMDISNSNASSVVNATNNVISEITLASTGSTLSHGFTGIYNSSNQAATISITGNTIGHAASTNAIITSSASSSNTQALYGIYSSGPGVTTISNNLISNLTNSATATSSVVGVFTNSGVQTVSKNFIHSLSELSTTGSVCGLNIVGASSLMAYYNNIINLGNTTSNGTVYGAYDTGSSSYTTNFYHNTIYIGGTAGAVNSYALYNAGTNNTRDYRNNVLFNLRSTSGSNYAIYYNNTGSSSLTADYNAYVVSGANNFVGYYATNVDLNGLKAMGEDANSTTTNPGLVSAGGLNDTDYKTQNQLAGSSGISGVTDDYGGVPRTVFTSGAWEFFSINILKDGVFKQSYATLKGAFDKINDGTWTGNLAIEVNGSTYESASAVLNASGSGAASYSSLNIYPLLTNITIAGNFNNPLIKLNSASNVTLNGSVLQGNGEASLILKNTNSGANASVLFLSESAQNNSVKFCNLEGSPASATQGIVSIISTNGTGNNNNAISNCKISGTGSISSTRPYNAIYSVGASGHVNTGNVIQDNELYDFLNQGAASNGILLDDYSSAYTISGNSFYETSAFASTANVEYALIRINSPHGTNFVVSNNYLGGNAAIASGNLTKTGSDNPFYGIFMNVGNSIESSINGNVIKNFIYTNSSNANWTAIHVAAGKVDLGLTTGNIIGESAGTNSIYLTNTSAGGSFYGIRILSTDAVDCENTVMGSINVGAVSDYAFSFYGIYKASGSGNLTLKYNLIGGSTTDESLKARSTSSTTTQLVYGVFSQGTGTNLFSGNEVANIVNATTSNVDVDNQRCLTRGIYTDAGSNDILNNKVYSLSTLDAQQNNYNYATLIGIMCINEADGFNQNIKGNKVYRLINNTSNTIEMYGIFLKCASTGTNEVSRNFVHTFVIVSTDQAYLHGISLHTGTYSCFNNVVFLGNNITTGCKIWGIWNNSNSAVNIWNNTVYLSGQATSGTSNSFAFRDISTNPSARVIQNNIFWNGRANTAAISHFAIFLAQTANTTLNYNDYQFAQNFGMVGTTTFATLPAWKAAYPSYDINSIIVDPLLTNLGGLYPSDYQPGSSVLNGTPIAQVTTDYGFLLKSAVNPTMGAWEYVSNPVEVWNGSTHQHDYKTLKEAFDEIDKATWTGNLTIKIKANITETTTARLHQSGYTGAGGISSYTNVHIIPTRASIQVLGDFASSLIELSGTSGVDFDGRVDGTGDPYNLILQNSNTTSSASTVSFVNSTSGNTIEYCYVTGLSINSAGGIIQFMTSSIGNGNDNNIIQNNKITTIGTDPSVRVVNAVYSEGTVGSENSGNQVLNNQIFDVWRQGSSSNAIQIGSNSTDFVISGNSIYETSTFVPSGAYTYQGIRINNASGNGFVISGNYIGGKAMQCQGSALTIGSSTLANTLVLQPIYLNVGTGTGASVQGNTIQNIQLTSPNTAPFAAIYINGGIANVGTVTGNIIGSGTSTGSINLTGVSTTSGSYGVFVNSTGNVEISNNGIGSISTLCNASTSGHSFYAIYKPSVAGALTINGNTIGSASTSGSINATSGSTSSSQLVCGIYTIGTGLITIQSNTIANLKNSTTNNVVGNDVVSILFGGSANSLNSIQRNFVYDLAHSSVTISGVNKMTGIHLLSGSVIVSNNILWLGYGVTGNFGIYGLYDVGVAGQTNKIYHNTIYLNGTPSNTSPNSYAYIKTLAAGTTDIRDNIFYNARTGGNTAKHYALSLAGISGVTINANDYICTGSSFKNYLNTTEYTLLSTWKGAVSQDAASQNTIPFAAPASAIAINFRPILDLYGVGVSITSDFGLNPRNASTPTIGAWERVNKWKGNISIEFSTSGNWTFNMVPAAYDNIIFDDAPLRPCTMHEDRFVTNIVNNQATHRLIVNGYRLTIKGNLIFSNGAEIDASATGSMLEFNGLSSQMIPTGSLYENMVYNLTVNNSNNVILNGTLVLLNQLTVTSGKLNAGSAGATLTYGGTTAQSIESNCFLNEKVYNLTINNLAGVTINTMLTTDNDLNIITGASLTIPETKGLTVTGILTNSSGAGSLLLKSSALGTASLIQYNSGVSATVQRYIDGDTCAWHFMSTPVANQSISGPWIPSGTFGDGTGYDLYAWDEPAACWVYNLNTTVSPTWPASHPETSFVPGRGYLYAVQALHPTKQFVGTLNSGAITRALTKSSALNYIGFNLIGNPYPSSIDWNSSAGFNRSMLSLNGGGYYMWTWSTTANNYGVYNSADADGIGTNNVTRYIAPMQAFYVQAASAGTFAFQNAGRVHDGASVWLKSAQLNSAERNIRLSVSSQAGSDEIKLGFGYEANENGARKLFSPVLTAPSLYMNSGGSEYSIRRLTDTIANKYVPVNFKAGQAGTYTMNCNYDPSTIGAIFLEDRLTGSILDFSGAESYTFQASVSDAPERFVLHFGAVTPIDNGMHPNVWISEGQLHVFLENMIGDYTIRVTDLQGRSVFAKKLSGSEQCSVPLFGRGFYLVTAIGRAKTQSIKVIY